jgi:rsbT co-antagonist protein RsbR
MENMPQDLEAEVQVWATEVFDHLATILSVLTEVTQGDLSCRIAIDVPSDHPLGALCSGINDMVSALQAEQARNHEYQRALEDKLATIDQQQSAIRELSTPIMEVWEGILCLPIVGNVDTARSADMTDALLRAVVTARAHAVILDLTGIEEMDTATTDHFIRMAKAVRLLGADCVLTGINPHIAQTVTQMGVQLSEVRSHRSLREALQHFIRREQTRPTR